MGEPWRDQVTAFVDAFSDSITSSTHLNQCLLTQYLSLERRLLASNNIRPIDVRATLPDHLIANLVAALQPASLHVADPTSKPKLLKACHRWNIQPTHCVFLLDCPRNSRKFFASLSKFATVCPDWKEACQKLCRYSRRRFDGLLRRPGVSPADQGILPSDVQAAIGDHKDLVQAVDIASHSADPTSPSPSPTSQPGPLAAIPSLELDIPQGSPVVTSTSNFPSQSSHNPLMASSIVCASSPAVTVAANVTGDEDDKCSALGNQQSCDSSVLSDDFDESESSLSDTRKRKIKTTNTHSTVVSEQTSSKKPRLSSLSADSPETPAARACLMPGEWLTGAILSSVLEGFRALLPTSTFVTETAASELSDSGGRSSNAAKSLLNFASPDGVTFMLPVNHQSHWTLASVTITQGQPTIHVYDSMPSDDNFRFTADEARKRLSKLLVVDTAEKANGGSPEEAAGKTPTLASISAWPAQTDWVLWRRVLAAFLVATFDDDDKSDNTVSRVDNRDRGEVLAAGKPPILAQLRRHHNIKLGIDRRTTTTVQIPETLKNFTTAQQVDVEAADDLLNDIGKWAHHVRTISHIRRITAKLRQRAQPSGYSEPRRSEKQAVLDQIASLRSGLSSVDAAGLSSDAIKIMLSTQIADLEEIRATLEQRQIREVKGVAGSLEGLQAMDDEVDMLEMDLAAVHD
nr:uncharacterized protein CTRU02_15116 [Colletotrichum truncatum]KAF6781409.1 hypothetical protein CTRU02_15116 [Colletotrichum truncatum]